MLKYLLCLLLVVSCKTQQSTTPTDPVVTPPVVVVPTEPTPPVVVVPPVVVEPTTPTYTDADIMTIVNSSTDCLSYAFGNRGKLPAGYVKAVALTFAHQVCKPDSIASNPIIGNNQKDVLAHYELQYDLPTLYSLLLGSGMRESSGKQCEGVDASATNYAANTAEAGLHQTSYNAFLHPNLTADNKKELEAIFDSYLVDSSACYSWNTCTTKNYGSGRGYEFQKLTKQCPAFAIRSHAELMRVVYRHYGPLINKAAVIYPACTNMLVKIQEKVKPTCK